MSLRSLTINRFTGHLPFAVDLPSLDTAPHLRPLPSASITPHQRYYEPLRHLYEQVSIPALKAGTSKNIVKDSWATIRDKLNRIRRITTKMVKNQCRYLITEVDQDQPPCMVQFFAVLGYVYDPDATRTVSEHVEEASAPVSQKPPDS